MTLPIKKTTPCIYSAEVPVSLKSALPHMSGGACDNFSSVRIKSAIRSCFISKKRVTPPENYVITTG